MLACHMDVTDAEHREAVGKFWNSPGLPDKNGLKAVEMFDAVADGRGGLGGGRGVGGVGPVREGERAGGPRADRGGAGLG